MIKHLMDGIAAGVMVTTALAAPFEMRPLFRRNEQHCEPGETASEEASCYEHHSS